MSKGGAENPITNANVAHSSFMEMQVLTGYVVKPLEDFGPQGFVWSPDRLVSPTPASRFHENVACIADLTKPNMELTNDE